MTIELIPLAIATATLAEPFFVPDTPIGTRVIAEITGFDIEGDRIRGHMKGNAGADWLTLSPSLLGTLDVRVLIETDDGALIFTSYRGRIDLSAGQGTSPAYAAPLYDTGDERYAWINKIQAVAKGVLSTDATQLVYEIYEIR
jgi:hypothetical protein